MGRLSANDNHQCKNSHAYVKMELNSRNARDIFAKKKSVYLTDVTIINTPKPQASSTVDKKHGYEFNIIGVKKLFLTFHAWFFPAWKNVNNISSISQTERSSFLTTSLGIINNISSSKCGFIWIQWQENRGLIILSSFFLTLLSLNCSGYLFQYYHYRALTPWKIFTTLFI